MAENLSIAITGDLFPNDRFYVDGRPLTPLLEDVLGRLKASDISHATFLMPLSERGGAMEKVAVIRAHPDIAEDVARLGFDLFSLANNHTFDFGPDALYDTVEALTQGGTKVVGAGANLAEASEPVVINARLARGLRGLLMPGSPGAAATESRPGISGIRVHSSYEVHPAWSVEEPGEPELVQIHTQTNPDDERRALDQIKALRSSVDILVVTVHWGFGAGERLAEYQRPLGKAFIDAGADVVFGHHVHGVQGVEVYEGRPIFYSPGTFIGRQQSEDPSTLSELAQRLIADMTPDGYIAEIGFNGAEVDSVTLTPTTHDERGIPHIAKGDEFERVAGRIRRGSSKVGTTLSDEDGRIRVHLK